MLRNNSLRGCFILAGLTASLCAAGPLGSIFFDSVGNAGDVQLILNGGTPINASNTGWYQNAGLSNEPNGGNYITGLCSNCGGPIYRSLLVFNIPVGIPITSATLNINTYTYDSTNPSELLTLWDVTTSLTTLEAGTGGISAYNDLGSGVFYGSRVYTAADQNNFETITLDAAAISAIQSDAGGSFAIGGALDVSSVVPEPSTFALLAGALSLIALYRVKIRRAQP
jgi:hypothetical protein